MAGSFFGILFALFNSAMILPGIFSFPLSGSELHDLPLDPVGSEGPSTELRTGLIPDFSSLLLSWFAPTPGESEEVENSPDPKTESSCPLNAADPLGLLGAGLLPAAAVPISAGITAADLFPGLPAQGENESSGAEAALNLVMDREADEISNNSLFPQPEIRPDRPESNRKDILTFLSGHKEDGLLFLRQTVNPDDLSTLASSELQTREKSAPLANGYHQTLISPTQVNPDELSTLPPPHGGLEAAPGSPLTRPETSGLSMRLTGQGNKEHKDSLTNKEMNLLNPSQTDALELGGGTERAVASVFASARSSVSPFEGQGDRASKEGEKLNEMNLTQQLRGSAPFDGAVGHTNREVEGEKRISSPWSPVIERIAGEISTQLHQNRHEAFIQLEPPELGGLRIDLVLKGDKVQVHIVAEAAEAGRLVQDQLPELRQALQAHKLELVEVRVDVGEWNGERGDPSGGFRRESGEQQEWGGIFASSPGGEADQKGHSRINSFYDNRGNVSVWA